MMSGLGKGEGRVFPRQKERPVQRHRGKKECGMFEEQQMVPKARTQSGSYTEVIK